MVAFGQENTHEKIELQEKKPLEQISDCIQKHPNWSQEQKDFLIGYLKNLHFQAAKNQQTYSENQDHYEQINRLIEMQT